jgi:adenylate cyclase
MFGGVQLVLGCVEQCCFVSNRDRYRAMATELGFEGHMKWAEAMT